MVVANLVLVALFGFLVASFSTAVVVSRLVYRTDVRTLGSGNAGATNILRAFGWKPAVVVLAVDVTKGYLPTLLAPRLQFADMPGLEGFLPLVAGAAAVLGHCYPIFAGFRGGKGVATASGVFLALYPTLVPVCIAVFVATVAATRYVSLASVGACVSMPVVLAALRYGVGYDVSGGTLFVTIALAGFIVFTHRTNLTRVRDGTEPRFGS
jgi:glycerol-3-phosphate acyltransferase PlsY